MLVAILFLIGNPPGETGSMMVYLNSGKLQPLKEWNKSIITGAELFLTISLSEKKQGNSSSCTMMVLLPKTNKYTDMFVYA